MKKHSFSTIYEIFIRTARICGPWAITHCLYTLKKVHLTGLPLLLVATLGITHDGQTTGISYFPQLHVAVAIFWASMDRSTKAPFYHPVPTHSGKALFQRLQDQSTGPWSPPVPSCSYGGGSKERTSHEDRGILSISYTNSSS